jgi:hypothetical protein
MVESTVIDEETQDGQQEQCQTAMAICQHSGAMGVAHYDFETHVVRSAGLLVVYVDINAPELQCWVICNLRSFPDTIGTQCNHRV